MRLSYPSRVALAALALLPTSCKAFDETLLDPPDSSGPSCDVNRPPSRPLGDPDPGDGTEYTFAIRDLLIDQRDGRWESIGYDLDDLCSGEPDFAVECRAPTMSAPSARDGELGTDNSLGAEVVPVLIVALPDLQDVTRADQTKGAGVALLTIRGWNGLDDDPLVEVVFAQSAFGTTVQPDRIDSFGFDLVERTLFVNGEPWPGPEWAGEDYWYARSDSFLEGNPDRPRIRDNNAYVANGTVVMRLPDRFPIVYGGQMLSSTFLLSDAYFTAKISDDRQNVEFAVLAGRFAILDILQSVRTAGVCPGSDDYENFTRLLDLAADIRTVPGTGGPTAVCDALSVGLLYESGVAARIGGVADPIIPEDLCGDGGVPDGGMMDGGTPDTGVADTGVPDSGMGDGGVADSSADALDAGVPMDAPDA